MTEERINIMQQLLPIEYDDSISCSLAEITREIGANPTPEKRGNPTHWREMVLVDVVENFVIQGNLRITSVQMFLLPLKMLINIAY